MSELVPYTESRRDAVEAELAEIKNKRELEVRYSYPFGIYSYWLVKEQVCSIFIEDTVQNTSVEYTVPPEQVHEQFVHALGHPEANFPEPWDGQ